jgi:hypothetical protein
MTVDPETGEQLPISIRTSNKFYDDDHTDVHGAIFPHHDLNSEKDYIHFVKCKERFKKLKNYNTLFNYTYNKWENDISITDMEEIVTILKNTHKFENFKVCFIGVGYGVNGYIQSIENEYYDNWELSINNGSFTGGLFTNRVDNDNYIDIIKSYDISKTRITKEKIDKNEF